MHNTVVIINTSMHYCIENVWNSWHVASVFLLRFNKEFGLHLLIHDMSSWWSISFEYIFEQHRDSSIIFLICDCIFWCGFFSGTVVFTCGSKFIDSLRIHPVDVALVKINEKHNICEKFNMMNIYCILLQPSDNEYRPSLKQPIRYIVGIFITKAKISSIKVFNAL